ncbi:hypothetical protein C6345_04880 [Bacillus sp. LNXM12-2]|nr:hypothetical protein C6Y07_02370 [Bacillus sp. LNXM12-1]PSB75090.1 hypothetical protein C6345_04880 [Bacillus sp. LNXM12-2]
MIEASKTNVNILSRRKNLRTLMQYICVNQECQKHCEGSKKFKKIFQDIHDLITKVFYHIKENKGFFL